MKFRDLDSWVSFSQDIMKLMDDMAALKPTIFCSVPRLYNRIYDGYAIFFVDISSCQTSFLTTLADLSLQNHKCREDIRWLERAAV